ncbi:helix-turn-helix domain-containing protein [Streptomyces sp. NPDC059071]|uniref:helix-turn-helix domain-containing protein n=1 Tax=unclassified Streptomyces TaxID=2593676 RepID=UPI00365FB5B0
MSSPLPKRVCRYCEVALPERPPGRGRPADYCSAACRQGAYRERNKERDILPTANPRPDAKQPPPPVDPFHEQLLQLAADLLGDARHLARLLGPGTISTTVEYVEAATQLQRRTEALTAGLIMLARQRRVPWSALGKVMNASPETIRRTFRKERVERLLGPEVRDRDVVIRAIEDADGSEPEDSPPRPVVEEPRRAANQLAPILSQLHRNSGLPLRQLGLRARVSASYLSRILAGEKHPTWDLTERIGQALGADCEVLHKIWTDDRSRSHPQTTPRPVQEQRAHTSLTTALRSLYRRATRPAPRILASATGGVLAEQDILDVLQGTRLPDWPTVERIVLLLDGVPGFYRPLWERASHDAVEAGSQGGADTSQARMHQLMTAFGGVLGEGDRHTATRRFREARQRLAITRLS